jgi:uncharacterized membrane protein YccC
MHFAGTLSTR